VKSGKRKTGLIWTAVLGLVVALVAIVIVGCGSDADTSGGPLQLGEPDNGKAFTVSIGDTITVVLVGNPTTGYAWSADLSQEAAALLESAGEPEYAADPTEGDIVGAGGAYTFTFTAKAKGEADLDLIYWRSFEADVEPIDTFTAKITIE
jgi:inhibitor of cysteine peptidase